MYFEIYNTIILLGAAVILRGQHRQADKIEIITNTAMLKKKHCVRTTAASHNPPIIIAPVGEGHVTTAGITTNHTTDTVRDMTKKQRRKGEIQNTFPREGIANYLTLKLSVFF